jgi:hypothetical protein
MSTKFRTLALALMAATVAAGIGPSFAQTRSQTYNDASSGAYSDGLEYYEKKPVGTNHN